jgi:site-specific recombinase XerD
VASTPTDELLGRFARYLLAERGLAEGTVVLYLGGARRFLAGLSSDRRLAELVAGDVTAAVLRESEGVSVSAAQNFVSGLRSFLRFCFIEGLVESDLTRAALFARGRQLCAAARDQQDRCSRVAVLLRSARRARTARLRDHRRAPAARVASQRGGRPAAR